MNITEKKTKRITINLTITDYDKIKDSAENAGLTLSDYSRKRLLCHAIYPKLPRIDMEALAILNRVSGMIKQIFKNNAADTSQTWAILEEVKCLAKQIRRIN